MKNILFFLFISTSLLAAQPPIYMAPPATLPSARTPPKQEMTIAAQKGVEQGSTDVMIITPKDRAEDLKGAIKFLKERSPTSKPTIRLTDGTMITNILDVDVMPGGTLLIFRINTMKGMAYKVVKIEDIDTLAHE